MFGVMMIGMARWGSYHTLKVGCLNGYGWGSYTVQFMMAPMCLRLVILWLRVVLQVVTSILYIRYMISTVTVEYLVECFEECAWFGCIFIMLVRWLCSRGFIHVWYFGFAVYMAMFESLE